MLAFVAANTWSTCALAPPAVHVSRRAAAAALLSLPALWPAQPAAALFGLGGDDGPQGEFRQLTKIKEQLSDLSSKLTSKELDGSKSDDAIVVLQTLTIVFGGTASLLQKTTAAMPLLEPAELSRANDLAARVTQELDNVRQGCRDKSGGAQLDGVKSASSALDEYLAVAAARYTLPAPEVSLAYSKDPKEFAKQYYGFFSCEGQGLERVSGSNTCKDKPPESRGSNINPFPTKPLLDFDFLTGQERPGMVKDK